MFDRATVGFFLFFSRFLFARSSIDNILSRFRFTRVDTSSVIPRHNRIVTTMTSQSSDRTWAKLARTLTRSPLLRCINVQGVRRTADIR